MTSYNLIDETPSSQNKSVECKQKPWLVYVIKTKRNTFYTGITNDLKNRWQAHLQGKGAKYLRSNKPEAIVFIEKQINRSEATKREMQIKKLKREQKLILIASAPTQCKKSP